MVTLHNLSAEPAKVRLPDDPDETAEEQRMRQVLGDADPPYIPGRDIILAGTVSAGCGGSIESG